jgi:hypothetical protein
MPEAPLEDSGSGLAPAGDGWFVVNVRDAQWLTSENGEKRATGSECVFESPEHWFRQFAIKLHVLEPGEPSGTSSTAPPARSTSSSARAMGRA